MKLGLINRTHTEIIINTVYSADQECQLKRAQASGNIMH